MRLNKIDEGFNNIRPWLSQKLKERGITSVDSFCIATASRINPTAVWRWYADDCRPYPATMKIVCETLSRLPVILPNGEQYLEHVPWSEGLSAYSPRPRAWAAHYLNRPTPSPSPTGAGRKRKRN